MKKNNSALFYTCSLIEFIARETNNRRCDIVDILGKDEVERIYCYADVFHCEPIAKVADDFIGRAGIKKGNFDNISACRYEAPDYWDIGEVFARLIEDSFEEADAVKGIFEVYHSWIADKILNFNSDMYYQSREYLRACYQAGSVLL